MAREVRAQVVEPNGVVVPGVSSNASETSLQSFFDTEAETIRAVADAGVEPGTFSPLCDFEAALVLSQSSALAGIVWYNVPTSATGAPTATYPIVPAGTPVGQTVSSADIRSNTNYAGGLVGFALLKNGIPAYYSEYSRNANCTQCTTPGYWKMALVYRSQKRDNTFYLAFEDWEGANESTWFGNDGDFNDKVFRITGVSCPGGGVACETGLPGVCAPGLTECKAGGKIECKQQVEGSAEKCDGLDNDCDGELDDGELCPTDQVCDKGRCVQKCGEVLFNCTNTEVCNAKGYCVDAKCADVSCDAGKICVGGECQTPCDGVSCPGSQVCRVGKCVDPCVGVTCEVGRVCEQGVCVLGCDCAACATGEQCAPDGHCVSAGCVGKACAVGTECSAGACVDSCADAKCPTGEKCEQGACVDACSGVSCPSGEKCLGGTCADACSNVQCGPGLKCVPGDSSAGECVDACAGVDCGSGKKCLNGVCGSDCLGVSCPTGEVCNAGACVNPCAMISCATSEVCRAGACVDRCSGVSCATGQRCELGVCVASVVPSSGGASASGGQGPLAGASSAGSGGSAGGTQMPVNRASSEPTGACGCRVPVSENQRDWPAALALAAALLGVARRRSSR